MGHWLGVVHNNAPSVRHLHMWAFVTHLHMLWWPSKEQWPQKLNSFICCTSYLLLCTLRRFIDRRATSLGQWFAWASVRLHLLGSPHIGWSTEFPILKRGYLNINNCCTALQCCAVRYASVQACFVAVVLNICQARRCSHRWSNFLNKIKNLVGLIWECIARKHPGLGTRG